jgi:signal transduction histidine kinase/CheY-like chemotaxis protein
MNDDLTAFVRTSTREGVSASKDPERQRQEIGRLRRENEALRQRVAVMMADVQTDRDARLATLNLLEDVVATSEAAEREIAERQRAEQALQDANLRKDEFLAMLAHELRNPLAAIRSAGQLLHLQDCDPVTRSRATDILIRQTSHMVRQVDDLLDVSRISSGKIELRKEACEVTAVVNHAVEAIRPLCENRSHELVVKVPPEPLCVYGDPSRLTQVVGNLLANACKFTEKRGCISLTVKREGDQAVIRISDNGIGIAAAELPRIFEIFAQVDRTLESSCEGLGLGLTLVKKLVELHGGTVEARSDGLGHGSEFVVRLPLQSGEAPRPKSSRPPSGTIDATTKSRRILVVDDNLDVASSLAVVLELMGHQVETVNDGLAAIERAPALQADVILLDIGMPGLNGYEVARRIREQGQEGLVLVALTGWGQEEDRRLSREAGFDAHLVKPVDMDALIEVFEGLEGE